jgi:hypothetical protein
MTRTRHAWREPARLRQLDKTATFPRPDLVDDGVRNALGRDRQKRLTSSNSSGLWKPLESLVSTTAWKISK